MQLEMLHSLTVDLQRIYTVHRVSVDVMTIGTYGYIILNGQAQVFIQGFFHYPELNT